MHLGPYRHFITCDFDGSMEAVFKSGCFDSGDRMVLVCY